MKHILATFLFLLTVNLLAHSKEYNQLGTPVTVLHEVDSQNQDNYRLIEFKRKKKDIIKRLVKKIHRIKDKVVHKGRIGNFVFSVLIGGNVIVTLLLVMFGLRQSRKNNAGDELNFLYYGFFVFLSMLSLLLLLIGWAFYNMLNILTNPELRNRKIEKPKRKKKSKRKSSTTQKKRKLLL